MVLTLIPILILPSGNRTLGKRDINIPPYIGSTYYVLCLMFIGWLVFFVSSKIR